MTKRSRDALSAEFEISPPQGVSEALWRAAYSFLMDDPIDNVAASSYVVTQFLNRIRMAQMARNWQSLFAHHQILQVLQWLADISISKRHKRFSSAMIALARKRMQNAGMKTTETQALDCGVQNSILQHFQNLLRSEGLLPKLKRARLSLRLVDYADKHCSRSDLHLLALQSSAIRNLCDCDRDSCYICLEDFSHTAGSASIVFPECGHPLHKECLLTLAKHPDGGSGYEGCCGICRKRFKWDTCTRRSLMHDCASCLGAKLLSHRRNYPSENRHTYYSYVVSEVLWDCSEYSLKLFAEVFSAQDVWMHVMYFFDKQLHKDRNQPYTDEVLGTDEEVAGLTMFGVRCLREVALRDLRDAYDALNSGLYDLNVALGAQLAMLG